MKPSGYRWLILLLIIIIIVLVIRCCRPAPGSDVTQEATGAAEVATEPNLIIENENTVAWMTTNNSFADSIPASDPNTPPTPRSHWTGILFQLGDYSGSDRTFKEVEFYKDGQLILTLDRDAFEWINIVSDHPNSTEPMDLTDTAFGLYPNERPDMSPCGPLGACMPTDPQVLAPDCFYCIEGLVPCDTPMPLDPSCLRGRKLHAYQSPVAVMTYWQGEHGYEMSAIQESGFEDQDNGFRYWFKDPFSVRVYRANTSEWKMVELDESVELLGPGKVDQIKVKVDAKPPEFGTHQDPPWPFEESP